MTNDPALALRKEEFEQWLARRKEELEHQLAERKTELEKGFEDKVKARVEAQMKKGPFTADWEDDPRTAGLKKKISELRSRLKYEVKLFDERLTEKTAAMPRATFAALVKCLHPDKNKAPPTQAERDEALGLLTQWTRAAGERLKVDVDDDGR